MTRRAADLIVDCLAAHGVDRVFCVPGESYLAVLDALHDRNGIQTIVCRHEGGAGLMAIADGKAMGRPGVAFVSRGPGATNGSIAVHVAEQDAVPLVLFIGQVARSEYGRHAFQEVDYARMFSGFAKAVFTIEDGARAGEIIAKAFAIASSPIAGGVVVVLPEDMLEDRVAAAAVEPLPVPRPAAPSAEIVQRAADMLAKSKRPLILAGGELNPPGGRAALVTCAEALGIPVVVTFKRQDLFANDHPLFAGTLGFKVPQPQVDRYAQADLVIAVGTRLGEATTQGYAFPRSPVPAQPLIHVAGSADRIGREYHTALPIVADAAAFLQALAVAARPDAARKAWAKSLNDPVMAQIPWTAPKDGLLDMGPIVAALRGKVAKDAVFVTDAGNFSGWFHRHYPIGPDNLLIGAVGGAMGIGMPGAVAAGLRFPGRQVITFIGDGGILMTGSELATAVQYDVPVKVFVSSNGSYGTIRLHQEKAYKGRVHGTELCNPDFAAWGRSFGALGLTIRTIEEAAGVVVEALAHPGPVIVDVKTAVEHISPFTTIDAIRRS